MENIQLLITHQVEKNGYCVFLKPSTPYLISPSLVHEIHNFQDYIINKYYSKPWDDILYIVWCFHPGKITLKGLDFEFIYNNLALDKLDAIENYIKGTFDFLFLNYVGLGLPVINCSIVDRPFWGCTRELFLMNQVNFFNCKLLKSSYPNQMSCLKPLDIKSLFTNLYFPEEIYSKNKFYQFQNKKIEEMRIQLESYEFDHQNGEAQLIAKKIFDKKSQDTIKKIFNIASKDIKIIERFASLQKKEHFSFI